jgi:hypothetical protein
MFKKSCNFADINNMCMTKEQEIQKLTEWAISHLNGFIPYDTPNYEEVLYKEARLMSEAMYEYRTNPEGYKNVKGMMPEQIIDIEVLPF